MKNRNLGPFWKRTLSNIVTACTGVLLFLFFSNIIAVRSAFAWFFSVFSPFVWGIAIAYMLNMPMRFFENHLFARFRRKRTLSILATYLTFCLLLGVLVGSIIPQLLDSVGVLIDNFSQYVRNLNHLVSSVGQLLQLDEDLLDSLLLSYRDLANQFISYLRTILPQLLNATMQLGSGVISVFTAIIASVYMLSGKEKLLQQAKRMLYALLPGEKVRPVLRVAQLSDSVFSGFISGKIVDSAIIGAICFVFMSAMNICASLFGSEAIRMPYTLLISVIIGVTNVIPFFGPFIGAIPSVMIILMANPWGALWFTIFIIVLQQFDGNVLGPKILGDSTGLPAMWVLIAIIVFGGLFGFVGMLLGVPTVAVLYSLAGNYIEQRLSYKGLQRQPDLVRREAQSTQEAAKNAAAMAADTSNNAAEDTGPEDATK